MDLSVDLEAHRRVLAEVERLRQRRLARDGVHAELQRHRRRLPRRSERAAVRRHVRRRRSAPAARATTCSSRGRAPAPGTTTPSSWTRTAPAATQITPYVDGQAVTLHRSPTAAPAPAKFANSTLYLMSRAGTGLFGAGNARRGRGLQRRAQRPDDRRALRRQRHQPAPDRRVHDLARARPHTGQAVTFNASGSNDPDGTIVDYQWDLDGNGSYETDTGTTASATKTYTTEAHRHREAARDRQPERHGHRQPRRRGRATAADGVVHGDAEHGRRSTSP